MKEVNIEKIQLLDGKMSSIQIDDLADFNIGTKDIEGFQHYISHSNMLSFENKIFKVIFYIQIKAVSKNKKANNNAGGDFKLSFNFQIENFENLIKRPKSKTEKIIIDDVLGKTLLSISYSTARGIILSSTKGTWLQNAVIPLIKPDDLLNTYRG